MLCTEIVSDIQNNFCTQHVHPKFCKKIYLYWRLIYTLIYIFIVSGDHCDLPQPWTPYHDVFMTLVCMHEFFPEHEWFFLEYTQKSLANVSLTSPSLKFLWMNDLSLGNVTVLVSKTIILKNMKYFIRTLFYR